MIHAVELVSYAELCARWARSNNALSLIVVTSRFNNLVFMAPIATPVPLQIGRSHGWLSGYLGLKGWAIQSEFPRKLATVNVVCRVEFQTLEFYLKSAPLLSISALSDRASFDPISLRSIRRWTRFA